MVCRRSAFAALKRVVFAPIPRPSERTTTAVHTLFWSSMRAPGRRSRSMGCPPRSVSLYGDRRETVRFNGRSQEPGARDLWRQIANARRGSLDSEVGLHRANSQRVRSNATVMLNSAYG